HEGKRLDPTEIDDIVRFRWCEDVEPTCLPESASCQSRQVVDDGAVVGAGGEANEEAVGHDGVVLRPFDDPGEAETRDHRAFPETRIGVRGNNRLSDDTVRKAPPREAGDLDG